MWVTYAQKVPLDTRNAGGPRPFLPLLSLSDSLARLSLHSWAQPCSTLPALSAPALTQVLLLRVTACGCRDQVTTLTRLEGCV